MNIFILCITILTGIRSLAISGNADLGDRDQTASLKLYNNGKPVYEDVQYFKQNDSALTAVALRMLFFGQEESQWVMNNIEIQNDQSDPSEPDTAGIAVVKVKIWNNTLQNETQIVAKAAVEARFASQIDPTTGANNVAWWPGAMIQAAYQISGTDGFNSTAADASLALKMLTGYETVNEVHWKLMSGTWQEQFSLDTFWGWMQKAIETPIIIKANDGLNKRGKKALVNNMHYAVTGTIEDVAGQQVTLYHWSDGVYQGQHLANRTILIPVDELLAEVRDVGHFANFDVHTG